MRALSIFAGDTISSLSLSIERSMMRMKPPLLNGVEWGGGMMARYTATCGGHSSTLWIDSPLSASILLGQQQQQAQIHK